MALNDMETVFTEAAEKNRSSLTEVEAKQVSKLQAFRWFRKLLSKQWIKRWMQPGKWGFQWF